MKTLKTSIDSLAVTLALGSTLALGLVLGGGTTSAQPKNDATNFSCKMQGSDYATVAQRGNASVPIIIWRDTSFKNYTPAKRCKIVSDRLTKAVAQTGRLKTLRLTYGIVGKENVICYTNKKSGKCDAQNVLITLKPEDKGKEKEIINQMLTPTLQGSSSTLVRGGESGEAEVFEFGDKLDKQLSATTSPAPTPSIQPTEPQTPAPAPATP